MLILEHGIGWKADPETPGQFVSANISDYVQEIERLRSMLGKIEKVFQDEKERIMFDGQG